MVLGDETLAQTGIVLVAEMGPIMAWSMEWRHGCWRKAKLPGIHGRFRGGTTVP
jgi:hypothetical protein